MIRDLGSKDFEFGFQAHVGALGLGKLPKKGIHSVWTTLESFVPEGIKDQLYGRSAMASTFTAGLELAKQGKLEIKQDGLFRPIYMRGREAEAP